MPLWAEDARFTPPGSGDTVIIRSDDAWEDDQPDIIHFSGEFELKGNDWYLSADQATLYGKLDDPETVILTGSPAVILLTQEDQASISTVTGSALRITYQRDSKRVSMEGNASLTANDNTLYGGAIEYDFEHDQLSAGGTEGVNIQWSGEN
jgi:lipopolysaccharide transport protein LptA